jgi:hypothetical protein
MPEMLRANTIFADFPGLAAGVSYLFTIRPCNAAGCSAFTEVVGKTPDGSDECVLTQHGWYTPATLTLSYVLGAKVPTTLHIWAVGSFGIIQAPPLPLPTFSPIPTGDISFPFPPHGIVGFLSALTTPTGGLRCWDFDTVDTGPAPVSILGP